MSDPERPPAGTPPGRTPRPRSRRSPNGSSASRELSPAARPQAIRRRRKALLDQEQRDNLCDYGLHVGVRLRSHQPSARLERHGDRVPAGLWARILQRLLALNAAIWFNWQISSGLSWRILSVPRGESLNPVGNGVARRDARKAPPTSPIGRA